MKFGALIQGWRLTRGCPLSVLADRSGLAEAQLAAIETGETDPPTSVIEPIAAALGLPPSWLLCDPAQTRLITTDGDGDVVAPVSPESPDPVVERILAATREERHLFTLLTTVLQAGDPKLTLAAEASLRSLVKQARRATVPWQSRPSGHFEPPSD